MISSFAVLANHNIPIVSTSVTGDSLNTTMANTLSVSKALPNIPLVVQMPQSHFSSQASTAQDSQHLGIVTGPISTQIPVSRSEANKILVQNTTDVTTQHQQQQQLIAAAMASLSSSIPTAAGQTSPLNSSGNKLISASIANSIYQGRTYETLFRTIYLYQIP